MSRKQRRRHRREDARRERAEKRTKHHLTPKVRGGTNDWANLIILNWNNHHASWHRLFGNATLEEIIEILQRIVRKKHRQERQLAIIRNAKLS